MAKRTSGGGGRGGSGRAGLTYADTGVDLKTYDGFIGRMGSIIRRTHGPRVLHQEGGFAGLFRLDYNEKLFQRNYADPVLVAATDGVGTKLKLATALGDYSTVGIDLVAMSVNDLLVPGAEPLFFLDYIAVPSVEPAMLTALGEGVAEGCRRSGCALLGGETAEMPGVYPEDEFDLAGFAVGVMELKRAMDTSRVEAGDVVLGLASDGLRSNGFSLVRGAVSAAKVDLHAPFPARASDNGHAPTIGQALLAPTRIYADPIVRVQRAYKVKKVITGMAHVTGGGLADNLARSLNDHVDAVIDWRGWEAPAVFDFVRDAGGIDEAEMRRVFNMGIGYVVIVRPNFATSISKRLTALGERVIPLGRITKGKGSVREKG